MCTFIQDRYYLIYVKNDKQNLPRNDKTLPMTLGANRYPPGYDTKGGNMSYITQRIKT